jgi:hypothetical protein
MKKVLTILLVLGLVSTASAALSFDQDTYSVVAGSSVTLNVVSSDTAAWGGYIDFADHTSLSTSCVKTANAGVDASVVPNPYGYAGYYGLEAKDADPDDGWSIVAGTQFQFTINTGAGDNGQSYTIYLEDTGWNRTTALLDTATVNVTPEPMTIALLGLGGLFLRRRK